MYPGPGQWILPEDLWFARENFGLAKSALPLSMVARAAKLRVSAFGCFFNTQHPTLHHLRRLDRDNIIGRVHQLQEAKIHSNHLDRVAHWGGWYNQCYCKNLLDNAHWMKSKGITTFGLYNDIAVGSPPEQEEDEFNKYKNNFQRFALKAIRNSSTPCAVERIRNQVERWRHVPYVINGLPGHYSPMIAKHLVKLSKIVTPRVHAAVFTTIWNGWCSERRYQRRRSSANVCKFKCGTDAEDSLEHYSKCPVVLKVARGYLHFSYPLEEAINLWTLCNHWVAHDGNMRSLALLIYGSYMAHNTIRHNGIGEDTQACPTYQTGGVWT